MVGTQEGGKMTKKDFSKDVGNFKLSVSGNVETDNVQTEIHGMTIAIIGGMILLTKHVSDMIRKKDSHLYLAFMMAMFDALKGDIPDGKKDQTIDFKGDNNDMDVSSDIKPDGMPDQERFDRMLDKIFGGERL